MKTAREREPINNNDMELSGVVISEPVYSHEVYGEGFYQFQLGCSRQSEAVDTLVVTVSERLINLEELKPNRYVEIYGQIRTYNHRAEEDARPKLLISVFAQEIHLVDEGGTHTNAVAITGYICKNPVYRKTPLGREICDILIAVNRPYGKSDYIPTIAWGRNASFAEGLEIGTKLTIHGRLQSREYTKRLDEEGTKTEQRIAYELSANKLSVDEEDED